MGSAAALAPGAVFEDYRVLGTLATGRMGSTYTVEELRGRRQRALKVIHPHVVAPSFDPDDFDRVLRSGSELDREHYVEVLRTGLRAEDSTPWLVMQLLRGEDGSARVRSKGPLAAQLVIELFDQSCRALQKAHQKGEAHGDLKPENLFFASARHVGMPFSINLLDFGVARFVDTGEKLWKAPEQSPGQRQHPQIDVWALGLVGFFMLTGRSFWDAPEATHPTHAEAVIPAAGLAAATLDVPLPYPGAFDTWFSRCVCVDPDARFENAAAVLKGLRKVLAGVPLDSSAQRVHSVPGVQSQAVTVPPGVAAGRQRVLAEPSVSFPALSGDPTRVEPMSQAAPTRHQPTRERRPPPEPGPPPAHLFEQRPPAPKASPPPPRPEPKRQENTSRAAVTRFATRELVDILRAVVEEDPEGRRLMRDVRRLMAEHDALRRMRKLE